MGRFCSDRQAAGRACNRAACCRSAASEEEAPDVNNGTAEGGSRERSARSSAAAVSRDRASRARCRAARERALIWPGSSAALRWHASQGSRCSRSRAAVTAPLMSFSGRVSGERACASQKCRNHTAALSGGTFLQEHQTADHTLVISFNIEHEHPVFMLTVVGAALHLQGAGKHAQQQHAARGSKGEALQERTVIHVLAALQSKHAGQR